MQTVTISLYTTKGLLSRYEVRKCADNEAIKNFIKELEPEFYNKDEWVVRDIIQDDFGWVRVSTHKTGKRVLVNTAK